MGEYGRIRKSHMADIDLSDSDDLHFAAGHGDLQRVQQLLTAGADINGFDDDMGWTPLHYAVVAEQYEVAKYLIEHGADVNAHHEARIGNTPLAEIADRCSLRIARLLVDAGADPTIPGWMQLTALDRARSRRRGEGPKVYELLLRTGRNRSR
jgi:ankyrin repeat protein